MTQPHLRSVPSDGGTGAAEPPAPSGPTRSAQRSRATKSLPTDRVKFDMQVEILRTFARLSGGRRPVNSEQIANSLKVSTNTASLSNGFFAESGWLERVGRGQYVATEAVISYNRRIEFGASPTAVALLAEPAQSSWYWQALEPSLSGARLSRNEALVILATEANTVDEHRPQLENLLQWLEFLGMIKTDGDYIAAVQPTPNGDDTNSPQAEQEGDTDLKRNGQAPSDRPEERRSTPGRAGNSGDVVIAFSTDLRLTGEDLAALSPDQIRALFEAVGTVASLTQRQ